MYDHFGVFTYTIELWDLPTEAGIKERKWIEWWRDHPHEEDLQILSWADEHAAPDAYVEWQPYDHPQLGKVELGGWNNMYTWRNPPLDFVESEVKKHYPFMLSLGEMLPHLAIYSLRLVRSVIINFTSTWWLKITVSCQVTPANNVKTAWLPVP